MVNPMMPTDPYEPAHAARPGILRWLASEVWDHLWPWSRDGFQRQRALQGGGLALGLAATVVWILAALGHVEAGALIGWWFGWSVFEILVRLGSKPYVKEGPWWGRRYRRASAMDMICYVGFKNLLIGAVLFIALQAVGVLSVQP